MKRWPSLIPEIGCCGWLALRRGKLNPKSCSFAYKSLSLGNEKSNFEYRNSSMLGIVVLREYGLLIRSYWPILCFGLLAVFSGNFGQSFFISWFGSEIQSSLNLSATQYGGAYSLATLVSGFLIMFAGSMIDRVSLHVFVVGTSVGLIIATLFLWNADSLVSLTVAFFLIRFFGQGLMPHIGITAMGRFFSVNRGKAISVVSNGIPLGEIILPLIVVVLIGTVGWQKTWLMIGLLVLLMMLPLMLVLLNSADRRFDGKETDSRTQVKSSAPIDRSRSEVLRDSRFWLALPLILAPPFIITGIFIHQGFILSEKGWSSSIFASAFVVYGITHWLSSMITGWLVDKFSAVQLLKFVGLPFVLSLAVGALAVGSWTSFIFLACLGVGIGAVGPVVNALWAEVYGVKYLGGIRSFTSSLMIISTAISPALFGFLIDQRITVEWLLISMAIYILLSSAAALFSYRSHCVGSH